MDKNFVLCLPIGSLNEIGRGNICWFMEDGTYENIGYDPGTKGYSPRCKREDNSWLELHTERPLDMAKYLKQGNSTAES